MPERDEPAQDRTGRVEPESANGPEESRQLALMQRMVDLSVERTRLAAQRTEMSAERSYLNAERTLSVWIRTALAVMVVGIAVDRFGLFLLQNPRGPGRAGSAPDLVGIGLVALGVLIAVVPSVRFARYSSVYRRTHTLPHHHGPFMAPAFAGLVALFGVVLLVLLVLAL
jgi:putative membrane protein